jgi:ABC-type branched-subunit amino acid transport system ATPase component
MLVLGRAPMMLPSLPLMEEPSIGFAPRVTADVFGSIARPKNADVTIIWWNRTHAWRWPLLTKVTSWRRAD